MTTRLGGYIKLSIADRREAVKELAAEGLSNVAVGEVLGVDETTVRRDAANAERPPGQDRKNNGSTAVASAKAEPADREASEERERQRQIEDDKRVATANLAQVVNTLHPRTDAQTCVRLIDAKERCGHGKWLSWIEREFGWTDKTAQNFMNVAERLPLISKVENFTNLDASGLYLLGQIDRAHRPLQGWH